MATTRGQRRLPTRNRPQDTATASAAQSPAEKTDASNDENSFSVVFSLGEASETECFVARHKELDEIHKVLSNDSGGRRAITLHGLGGIGKTQLAIAYAKAHQHDYSAIFWLNIKDEISVKQSFVRVATRIFRGHPRFGQRGSITDTDKLDEELAAVKEWLNRPSNKKWLLIFDNYDNPGAVDIHQFIPEAYHGSVMVTTRSSKVNVGRRMQINKFRNELDSLQILADTSHRPGTFDNPDAAELAKELDGLPLALATAGAYLDQMPLDFTFADYLRFYRTSWLKLQETSPEVFSYEDRQLYTTWQLSLEHVQQQNENSARLLQLWAYFDNQDLWFELLRGGRLIGPEWFHEITEDELCYNEAIRVLCDHGLVEVNKLSKGKGFSIHHCVHSWTVHVLNQHWDTALAGLALCCVAQNVPDKYVPHSWALQQRLLPHADRCLSCLGVDAFGTRDKGSILYNLGSLYVDQRKLRDAERMYQKVHEIYKKADGPESLIALTVLGGLATVYKEMGRLEQAEKTYRQTLYIYERTLGPEHDTTSTCLNNLASLLVDIGHFEEAVEMYHRALRNAEKSLGPTHQSTLVRKSNLARCYGKMGSHEKAGGMFKELADCCDRVLGPDHALTLDAIRTLGIISSATGNNERAIKVLQRALAGYKRAFDPTSDPMLLTITNMGLVYGRLGKLDEAEKMYRCALVGYQKTRKYSHKLLLEATINLGWIYVCLERPKEAVTLYNEVVEGYETELGPDHQLTVETVEALGSRYKDLNLFNRADKLYQRIFEDEEEVQTAS